MPENLDLTPLVNAVASLSEALTEYTENPSAFMRDSCLKRFEYTYELSHKMLKRHLKQNAPNPADIDQDSFQDLIRMGYDKGLLLNSWDIWKDYRHNRNRTAHGYDKDIAEKIVASLHDFYGEADYLLQKLKHHAQ